ncbi:hypothetical protein FRC03_001718 [Tulasnella sp. 419]|nr:hypothetical protein FRC03_001718 [Tulasnella sp. 419]
MVPQFLVLRTMFRLCLLLAVLSLYLQRAVADTVIVGAQDPRIVYSNQSTRSLVPPGPNNCAGQMLTEKVGDYAEFEFEGDSIAVYGSRLFIQSIRYSRPMKPTPHIPSMIATGAVAVIALLGAVALQLFKTGRWRSFNRRRAGHISYDASNLPPFSKTISRPSTAKTTSDYGTLQSTNATVNEK